MDKKVNIPLAIFSMVVYLFLLIPMIIVIVVSFGSEAYLAFPPESLSLKWYKNIFEVDMFMTTFKVSIIVALIGNVAALIIGLPAAYAISRFDFKGKGFMSNFFVSPILIPGVVLGFALLKYLIITYNLNVFTSLLIGHVVLMTPYIVRVIASSLSGLDYSIEEAAMSLGASRLKAFFVVVLPNIKAGLLAGVMLSFLESFNTVDVSLFLTGPGISTLPIQMLTYVEYNFDPTIAAISTLLMGFTIILMFLIERSLGLAFFTKK